MKRAIACLAAVALWAAPVREARACGGCFHETPIQQSQSATQVTGHRMILSLGQKQTTLYDQIQYVGEPSSFAWVLPIKGTATVGLSSDAVFAALDNKSQVRVDSPVINCPPPPVCNTGNVYTASSGGFYSGASGSGGGSGGGEVTILAQETVGPYETVQLSATDPGALQSWLASHGYEVPKDVQPIIAAFVAEKSSFLAMKLVPGAGVQAMRPVRVTTPGAGMVLPLRMVAAGTGATTTMTLWIIGDGRYQPKSAPWFTIDSSEIVWDWSTQSSNYTALRDAKYAASGGTAWQVEVAEELSTSPFVAEITAAAKYTPGSSGYDAGNAVAEANDDLQTLFAGVGMNAWITRLRGELARKAFDQDMVIEAAAQQSPVYGVLKATSTTGIPPSCPSYPPCPSGGDRPGLSGTYAHGSDGCAASGDASGDWSAPLGATLAALAAISWRARRRRSSSDRPRR